MASTNEVKTGELKIDKELLSVLVCPECKGKLEQKGEGLACEACRLLFPVKDGIPVMLASEANNLDE